MSVRAVLALVLVLVGCRGDSSPATQKPVPPAREVGSSTAPAAAADPWTVTDTSDDPPSLAERHRRANEACPRVAGAYFYRIEKAGKVSHILGTRHVGVPLAKFPTPVHDALATAKLAVFEVAPGDDIDLPDAKISLPDELGPDLWKHFNSLVGSSLASTLEQATPSQAAIMLIAMYEDIGAMLDMEIERKFAEAGVRTAGLESAAFQDRLLDSLLDIRMLRAQIKHTKDRAELAKDSREDLAEYCAGTDDKPGLDDDHRADLIASGYSQAELDKLDEQLVYARNEAWIPKLEKYLETENTFIAVGADHLTGKRGVVALLAARGYTLTRITK